MPELLNKFLSVVTIYLLNAGSVTRLCAFANQLKQIVVQSVSDYDTSSVQFADALQIEEGDKRKAKCQHKS